MKKDKYISDFMEKHLDSIKKAYQPSGLWFFGSRIYGQPKEESDIDMILVSEKFKNIRFIHRMSDFLRNYNYPKHIDALCYTAEEFERKKNEIGIIQEAVEKGDKII